MKLVNSIVSGLDLLTTSFKSTLKTRLSDYSDLNTAVDEFTFVAHDGSFASVIELRGYSKIMGKTEMREMQDKLFASLSPLFDNEGIQVQFCYFRNPEGSLSLLEDKVEPMVNVARQLGFKSEALFDSKKSFLPQHVVDEGCYLVLWSRPKLISVSLKSEEDAYREAIKSFDDSLGLNSQNIFKNFKLLRAEHDSNLRLLKAQLSDSKVLFEVLDTKKAANRSRRYINEELTSKFWEPVLPNSSVFSMRKNEDTTLAEDDPSSLLWPELSEQIFPEDVDVESDNMIQIGGRYISSMFIKTPPQIPQDFNALVRNIDSSTPFQISFMLDGDGLSGTAYKKLAATVLAAIPFTENKLVKAGLKELQESSEIDGNTVIKLNVNISTWSYDKNKARERSISLFKSIQSWGKTTPKMQNHDPIEGYVSCAPAISYNASGTSLYVPFKSAVYMLPLARPAHVWDNGNILFRSRDGKLIPYDPMSSKQHYWNDMIFAEPGSGKSVLMQALNLAKVFAQPLDRTVIGELPYIGILDIGFSSRGLIKFLKDNLPKEKRHQVLHKKLTNMAKDAVNVFDTQLGVRYPTPLEKNFLIQFLSTLTQGSDGSTISGMDRMIPSVIDSMYQHYSDDFKPKRYEPSKNKTVDKVLEKLKINPSGMTWWEVVDALFDKKQYRYAGIAQRYAVPTLPDCIQIVSTEQNIIDLYKDRIVQETGETLIKAFVRSISESVKMFECLQSETKLDVEDARIVALDLGEVAKGGASAILKQQSAVMYMMGRQLVAKNFFIHKELVDMAPSKYKKYHTARVSKSLKLRKSICYDEFHKTEGVDTIRSQVFEDMREGRKHKVGVTLASQVIDDFPDRMQKLSSSIFILSNDDYDSIVKNFRFTKTEALALKNDLNGINNGVPLISIFKLKSGRSIQSIYFTLSPTELWSFNSTAEDNRLIEDLELEFGSDVTRQILVDKFPNGSVVPFIEDLTNKTDDPEILEDPMGYVKDMLRDHYAKYVAKAA